MFQQNSNSKLKAAGGAKPGGSTTRPPESPLSKQQSREEVSQARPSGTVTSHLATPSSGQKLSRGASFSQEEEGGLLVLKAGCIRRPGDFLEAPKHDLAVTFKSLPVFASLTDEERLAVASSMTEEKFKKGHVVIKQGDIGEGFYVIKEGSANVTRRDQRTRVASVAHVLRAGDFFGEAALLTNPARGGSVIANDTLTVWFLQKQKCSSLFSASNSANQHNHFVKRKAISAEPNAATSGVASPAPWGGTLRPVPLNHIAATKRDSFLVISKTESQSVAEVVRKKSLKTERLLMDALSQMVLYQQISQSHKKSIVDLMKRVEVPRGISVIKQGETGADLYIIETGEFSVYETIDQPWEFAKKTNKYVEKLGPGKFFGELALMHEAKRNFTVTASGSPNVVWTIDRMTFRGVLADVSSANLQGTMELLQGLPWLRGELSGEELTRVAEQLEPYTFSQGQIHQETAPSVHIIQRGQAQLTVEDSKGNILQQIMLEKGDSFPGNQRSLRFVLSCVTDVECLRVDVDRCPALAKPLDNLLRTFNTLTTPASPTSRSAAASRGGTPVSGSQAQTVVATAVKAQPSPGQSAAQAKPSGTSPSPSKSSASGSPQPSPNLTVPSRGGTMKKSNSQLPSIIDEEEQPESSPSASPAISPSQSPALPTAQSLPKKSAEIAAKPQPTQQAQPQAQAQAQPEPHTQPASRPLSQTSQSSGEYANWTKNEGPSVEEAAKVGWKKGRGKLAIPRDTLDVIAFLGKGSYGHVQLVKDRTSGITYALKGVMKKEIVECNQIAHIVSEKNVMMVLDHPFLLNLYATYKDQDCVYFLLEPSLGGELFNVLRAQTMLSEEAAKFYSGSVVLAFEHLHQRSIIYRDLKPENILLSGKGFVKIADFGFAKELIKEENFRTFTLCGTPDYLAPEVILGTGHSFGFDWWCLGVFIYELLHGWPPFCDESGDVMKTYENIVTGKMKFPDHLSQDAISVISDFMQYKPTDRLGMGKHGVRDIKMHPWFKGFDWEGLAACRMDPPVIPAIKNELDISNFDPPEDGRIDRDVESFTSRPEDRAWEDQF